MCMRSTLAAVAAQQFGAFTTKQARECYSPKEIRVLVSRGEWVRVHRGVFRDAVTTETAAFRTVAAQLRLGCTVVACHDTAAQLLGFDILEETVTHVITARKFSTAIDGMVVHRTSIASGDWVRTGGLWTTSPARTAIDLARAYDRMDALALLDAALRHGVTREALAAELGRHVGKRGFRQAKELFGYATGKAESPMESRTLMQCIDAGLPIPEQQIYVPIPFRTNRWLDLGWRKWKIGLDYDSTDWHTGEAAASRDNPRHNWLTRHDWTMYYATPQMVFNSPEDFTGPILDHIAAAHATCRSR